MAKRIAINETVASPAVTFDINDPAFQKILAEAVAARMAVEQPVKADKPKTDQSAQNEWLAKKAFAKRGFTDVRPNQNVFTYNRWLQQGYRVKAGEHAVKCGVLRLFHVTQVEAMNAKDKAEALAALKAKTTAREAKAAGKVVPLGPSAAKLPPVELVPQAAPKKARRAKAAPTNQPSL